MLPVRRRSAPSGQSGIFGIASPLSFGVVFRFPVYIVAAPRRVGGYTSVFISLA
jgi:hypothetical protein